MMKEFTYSKTTSDLSDAYVRIIYNDGKVVEPLSKNYNGLQRTNLKSATIISKDDKPLYTLNLVNNKLIYRKRNLAKGIVGAEKTHNFETPKRCIILATEGKIVFFWDSQEVKEFTDWQNVEPYTCPNLRDDEK